MRKLIFVSLFLLFILLLYYFSAQVAGKEVYVADKPNLQTMPILALNNTSNYKAPVKPKTAPRGVVASASVSLSTCEQYRPLLEKYDWNVEVMMRIMKAESGCNPNQENKTDNHHVCMGSYGLLQIGCLHFEKGENRYDVALNIQKGYQLYAKRGNYYDWTTF